MSTSGLVIVDVLGGRAIWFPVWLSRLPSVGPSALSLLVDDRSRVKRSKPAWRTEKWTRKKKKDNTHAAPPKRATKRLCIAQIESGFSRGCLETASRNQQQVHTHMEKSCRVSFRLQLSAATGGLRFRQPAGDGLISASSHAADTLRKSRVKTIHVHSISTTRLVALECWSGSAIFA